MGSSKTIDIYKIHTMPKPTCRGGGDIEYNIRSIFANPWALLTIFRFRLNRSTVGLIATPGGKGVT